MKGCGNRHVNMNTVVVGPSVTSSWTSANLSEGAGSLHTCFTIFNNAKQNLIKMLVEIEVRNEVDEKLETP